jgi:cytochrome P450
MRQWPRADFIRYFGLANSESLLLTSIAAHKELLVTNGYSFVKPAFFYRLVETCVGVGVVLAEGDPHKRQRRFLTGWWSPLSSRNSDVANEDG